MKPCHVTWSYSDHCWFQLFQTSQPSLPHMRLRGKEQIEATRNQQQIQNLYKRLEISLALSSHPPFPPSHPYTQWTYHFSPSPNHKLPLVSPPWLWLSCSPSVMVIYISENNNTRVVKPTEGRRGPQMSAPPLAPAAIHSAPTPVARQRQGQRHQREWLGRLQGERKTLQNLFGV